MMGKNGLEVFAIMICYGKKNMGASTGEIIEVVSREEIDRAIATLKKCGIIYEPRPGRLRFIEDEGGWTK